MTVLMHYLFSAFVTHIQCMVHAVAWYQSFYALPVMIILKWLNGLSYF